MKNWNVVILLCLNSLTVLAQKSLRSDSITSGSAVFFDLGICYSKHLNYYHNNDPAYSSFNENYRKIVKNDQIGSLGWGTGLSYKKNKVVVGIEFNKMNYAESYYDEIYDKGSYKDKQINNYEYYSFAANIGKVIRERKKILIWWRGGMMVEKKGRISADVNNLNGNTKSIDYSDELFNYYNPYLLSIVSDLRVNYKVKNAYLFAACEGGLNVTDILKKEAPFHNQRLFLWIKAGIMLPMFQFK